MEQPKTCFVIMPFGEKLDVDGQVVDFDKIYQFIIKQAVESLDMRCIRCDEIEESGWIHADMFEQILEADVSVVDITSLNANVFYELGVRHALTSSVTVLIRKKGTHAPFNIQGLRVIDYDPLDLASVDKAKLQIASFIQNGLRYKLADSPIHQFLANRVRIETRPEPILKTHYYLYPLPSPSNAQLCLVTGDIQDVRCADIWVNSENSNMQMDRYYDRSISSIIRYLGAMKDDAGYVIEDTIAEELAKKMKTRESVPPGHVLVTSSGELAKTHNVKKIFHAASVVGAIGQGYKTIQNINRCVTNALHKMEEDDEALRSILFPLMGTGRGKGELQANASLLLDAAMSYLTAKTQASIETIYFLTYTQEELETCRNILSNTHKLELAAIKT
ncbi:MAG: macro domain-containing protein [Leptolyngbya sp. SIO1E4]|nr:macro domain-containing protein [Leptolyngbya sp. SIO1E4]